MFRAIAIFAGSLIALGVLAVIGLNLYVQSVGAQARIQQELSQRLGVPVRIRSVSVTPWGGLTVSGISVSDMARKTDFLTAKAFQMHAALSSILSGNLLIKKVSLVRPEVVWAQDEDGRWRLPGRENLSETQPHIAEPPPGPADQTAATSPVPLPSLPSTSPQVNSGPVTRSPPQPKIVRQLISDVHRAAIRDGSFRFLDRREGLVAAFESVELDATVDSASSLHGVVHVGKLSAHDLFFLQNVRSPFKYGPEGINLPRISGATAGGRVEGSFSLQPDKQDSPFHVAFHFQGLKADDLVTDAGGTRGVITGDLDGTIDASGSAGNQNELSGSGEIVLRNGQLQQYSLLVALGQILQIEELTQLHLEQAEAKYHLQDGQVKVDQLVLRSPNLRLSAIGTIALNGKLRLDAQLAIDEKVRSQLFKPIRQNFQPTSDPQYSAVDFQVTGTLDRPKTNLVDRIVGRDLRDIVSGFLGGKKSNKSRKAPRLETSPSAVESSEPAADSASSPLPTP